MLYLRTMKRDELYVGVGEVVHQRDPDPETAPVIKGQKLNLYRPRRLDLRHRYYTYFRTFETGTPDRRPNLILKKDVKIVS